MTEFNCLEYDGESNEWTITILDDSDEMMDAVRRSPVVKKFVQNEILAKLYAESMGVDDGISGYEYRGFFAQHEGEMFTISQEYLDKADEFKEDKLQ